MSPAKRRSPAAAIGVVLALSIAVSIAACSDTSKPSQQGRAGSGSEGGLVAEERAESDAKPAPKVKAGVVPDLLGTTLANAQQAIKQAGFTEGDIEGGVGAGSIFPPSLLICEQDPEPGSSPKEGTEIALVAERECPD